MLDELSLSCRIKEERLYNLKLKSKTGDDTKWI